MAGYVGNVPVPQATQTRDNFTATSGQTTFATSGYTPGYLDVYLNGVHLDSSDYTATNGSDVVLATGATAGDIVLVVAYTTFTVAANIDNASVTTDSLTVNSSFTSVGIDDNATSTAMTLDASGNLLVGKTATGLLDSGFEFRGDNGLSAFTRNNGVVSYFNRNTGDGTIAEFRKDNSTVGSIGVNSGFSYIEGNSTGTGLEFRSFGVIAPRRNGAVVDGETDLGASSTRFRNLYLSGGVYLGGTGAANYLDDYEEGTWTPTYVAATDFSAITHDIQTGEYTKIGNVVYINCTIRTDAISGGSGSVRIDGLPFTPVQIASATVSQADFFSTNPTRAYFISTNSSISLLKQTTFNSNVSALNAADMGTTGNDNLLRLSGFYILT